MNNNQSHITRLAAFSILEVTIVIAMIALLSALFFGALNRFGEQIHNETLIKNELNDWYVIRANLWRELDEADSILVKDNHASIYSNARKIDYSIVDNKLFRTIGELKMDMKIEMNAITLEEIKNHQFVAFNVAWKNEDMILRFPLRSSVASKVNHYFTNAQWQ